MEKMMKPVLTHLTLMLSYYCNMSCAMCGQVYSGRRNREYACLPLEVIKRQIEDCHDLKSVYLFGGEPLLYPEFDELMKHPGIPKTEKLDVVQKIFDGRISPENSEFIKLIVKKDRYRELPAIFEYFSDKMKEYKKIGVAYVSTAVKLTAAQEQQIQKRILETAPYESVEMHYAVEPELIGGMVIRIGDRVVDSSIKSKLNDLTKQLLQIQLG